MKDEDSVQQEIRIEAKNYNCTLFRNNSGAFKDETGRVVRYGIANESKVQNSQIKSSDLIGITKVTITPEMVGQTIGVFTAIEVKKEAWKHDKKLDKRESAQLNFISWVKSNGGIAAFCNSINQLKDILGTKVNYDNILGR